MDSDSKILKQLKKLAWDVVQAYSGPHGTDRPPRVIATMEVFLDKHRTDDDSTDD